jgi:aspartyl/asparaginyl beta-hydroxylase (cupin superfamily)
MNCTNKHKKKEFYTSNEFPKMQILEKFYKNILEEFTRNLKESGEEMFEPWVEKELYQESNPSGWQVCPIIVNSQKIKSKHERFKVLCGFLDKIPGVVSAFFSWLKPSTEICEHQGYENYAEKILRYHLGLIIPKGEVALKCNNVIKYWQNGKSFIFDDSLIHGAWNKSNFDRYVLIVDFVKNDNESVSELKEVILTSEAQYFYEKYNKEENQKSD